MDWGSRLLARTPTAAWCAHSARFKPRTASSVSRRSGARASIPGALYSKVCAASRFRSFPMPSTGITFGDQFFPGLAAFLEAAKPFSGGREPRHVRERGAGSHVRAHLTCAPPCHGTGFGERMILSSHPGTTVFRRSQVLLGLHQPQGPPRTRLAPRSLRRALLTPQANPGSLYRCGKRT